MAEITLEKKKTELNQYAFAQGLITEAEVNQLIDQLASDCPAAVVAEKGLTEVIDKAYEGMLIQKGASSISVTATTTATAMPATKITSEESAQIRGKIAADYNKLVAASQGTVIEKLVFDSPEPKDLIAEGQTGLINEKSWNTILEKYQNAVMDDDPDDAPNPIKSRSNFEALKAAFEAKKPVKVYIGKQSTKTVAVQLRRPDSVASGAKAAPMSMADLSDYTVLETAGFILATESTPGAKLRYYKEQQSKKNPGEVKPERSVLALTNRSAAIKAGNFDISRVPSDTIKENAACKSELCFRVDTGKPKQNSAGNITRIVRVTVNAPVKETVRKPEYVEILGAVGSKSGAGELLTPPDAKQMESISKAQVMMISQLRHKVAAGDGFRTELKYGEQLKAFDVPATPAAKVEV